jgi:prephenate dehydrogenase
MEVLIVGAGEMGRWFARTLAAHPESMLPSDGDTLEFAFCDREQAVAERAATAVDAPAETSPVDGDQSHDLVCVAVPMAAARTAIETHADRAAAALVDITGEMARPLAAMAEHAPECEQASLHPLFAPDNAPGNVPIAVDIGGPTIDRLRDTLQAAGNTLVETTPAEHDEAMESIQSAAHTAVLAYALATRPVPEGFETPVSAGLDELIELVAENDPRVYAEIQSTFDGADRLATAARRIADAETDQFEELYAAAGDTELFDADSDEEVTDS